MIKAIIFDLDGTLLDRDRSLEAFINEQHSRLAEHLQHIPRDQSPSALSNWMPKAMSGKTVSISN